MKKFKDFKVGTKFIIKSMAILLTILIATFTVVIIILSNQTEEISEDKVYSLAEKNASIVDSELEMSLLTIRAVAQSMQGFENVAIEDRRDYYNNLLQNILLENDEVFGVWTCWEPNALDGLDSDYENKAGYDTTGRFIPYWYWADGGIEYDYLVDYDQAEYYLLAKDSGQETILDPFEYEVNGQAVLMTTVSIPIKNKDGNVVGVAGLDMALSGLQNMAFDKGDYQTSYTFLLSNNGTIVTHPKTEVVGQNLMDINTGNKEQIVAAVADGKVCEVSDNSILTGNEVKILYIPIHIGGTTTPWSTGIAVETSEMMAFSIQMTRILILVLAALCIIVTFAMWLIIKSSITKPIKTTAAFANSLASGQLDEEITIVSMDEIGQLTSILDKEVRKAFKDIEKARAIADKQSEYQTKQVDKLVVNLEKLAAGTLNCDMAVDEPDQDTEELYGVFNSISENLHLSVNTIKGYIDEISYTLSEVSDGNLVVEITSDYQGDFIALKDSINAIVESLNSILIDINTAAEQVASGTTQVSDGNQEISQGATEQASSIEELSSSITQMAEQIRQNATNATTSTELAIKSKDAANDGNEKMKGMLKSMEEINESSSNISKIIKVIDDIAFQTNILALNAAVEAARAGAHGKGFAVVAEEVRNLAARSANAANETTTLIEGSIRKVEAGTQIANETAGALSSIVSGAEESAELLKGIAVASNEQATGIAQINKGIEQLSQVVQTNSATAEEGAAASEELSSQAELLKSMIAKFTLKTDIGVKTISKNPAAKSGGAADYKKAQNSSSAKPKIVLNDSEFGKY